MAKQLLLVEDDPLISNMYQRLFRFEGISCELAQDGVEGWEKIQSLLPDLVLLDIMMPNMNGIQVLEKAKHDERTKHIPVIMLTNLAGVQDAEASLARGALKYVLKSEMDPADVMTLVKSTLGV